ncbi:hypothetical protein CONPUDRAFT_144305 [Coniophora puteana RWD-64-598 SS2]|uniref:C2H2-type domain-containing protein n=1 Tax=Coniophora puteana (strain RWD-64-598) TaxID=741705 RepID=A0A5M3MQY0_CONPW|nr:uncharacterized protein CONPUDRAFT_144305 [Coniophora puteana RWD-64-598 SS2]EIW81598.1 hypothetical protein CONPUDRAFT_144305 [Coniophora puteana RWD-64-598 SS2]
MTFIPEIATLPATPRPFAPPRFARKAYARPTDHHGNSDDTTPPSSSASQVGEEPTKPASPLLVPSTLDRADSSPAPAPSAPVVPTKRKYTYRCPYHDCGETFTRKTDRNRHMLNACISESAEAQGARREHPSPTWHCPVCGKVLSRRDATERHINKGTCAKGRCGMCGDRMTERAIKGHLDDMGDGNMKCFSAKLATKAARKSKKRKLEGKEDEEEELEVEVALGEDDLDDELEGDDVKEEDRKVDNEQLQPLKSEDATMEGC